MSLPLEDARVNRADMSKARPEGRRQIRGRMRILGVPTLASRALSNHERPGRPGVAEELS